MRSRSAPGAESEAAPTEGPADGSLHSAPLRGPFAPPELRDDLPRQPSSANARGGGNTGSASMTTSSALKSELSDVKLSDSCHKERCV